MHFDVTQIDELLSTTRAVRLRLDLDRDVPDELLLQCLELAEQAPTGGDFASRRWIVIRDPVIKGKLANIYRSAGGNRMIESAAGIENTESSKSLVKKSAAHLAENLERVPVLVIATIIGEHDGSGRPGLFDSVIQSAWSFCLALRSRGLGSAWTTSHLNKSDEVKELLGIPEGVTQIVLLPVAWTIGTEFNPASRRPISEIVWFDRWGYTKQNVGAVDSLLETEPGVTVEVDVAAPPDRLWPFVSDINLPARFSQEFQGAEWLDSDGPKKGASFVGRNERIDLDRKWETTSYVVACDEPRAFAWNVNDREVPSARWRFELDPVPEGTRLRMSFIIGPRLSATGTAMVADPDNAHAILAARREQHRRNMTLTVNGIKQLVEESQRR